MISTVRYETLPDGKLRATHDFQVAAEELIIGGALRSLDLFRLDARIRASDLGELDLVDSDMADLDDEDVSRFALRAAASSDEYRQSFGWLRDGQIDPRSLCSAGGRTRYQVTDKERALELSNSGRLVTPDVPFLMNEFISSFTPFVREFFATDQVTMTVARRRPKDRQTYLPRFELQELTPREKTVTYPAS